MTQIAQDCLTFVVFFFLWLPLVVFLLLALGFCVYADYRTEKLRSEYLKTLNQRERNIIHNYKMRKWLFKELFKDSYVDTEYHFDDESQSNE